MEREKERNRLLDYIIIVLIVFTVMISTIGAIKFSNENVENSTIQLEERYADNWSREAETKTVISAILTIPLFALIFDTLLKLLHKFKLKKILIILDILLGIYVIFAIFSMINGIKAGEYFNNILNLLCYYSGMIMSFVVGLLAYNDLKNNQ